MRLTNGFINMRMRNRFLIVGLSVLSFFQGCGYTKLSLPTYNSYKYFPSDLEIVYSSDNSKLNSVEGYIEKDVGDAGIARTTFVLSSADKSKIYEAVKDMDIESYPPNNGKQYATIKMLWIKYHDVEKRLSWGFLRDSNDEKLIRLYNLQRVLDDVLLNNPFYQMLPEYQGGLMR